MTGKPIEAFGRDPQGLDGEATKAAVREADAPETIALTQSQQAILNGLSEAQRRLILWHQPNSPGVVMVHTRGIAYRAADVLRAKGITHNHTHGWAELSPLGLAIREALLRTTLLQANRNGK
jgi:hypothetical protein